MRTCVFAVILAASATLSAQQAVPAAPVQGPAAATPADATSGTPARHGAPDYLLGPGDTLKVTVFDEPTLTGSYKIDSDGSFDYPFLKKVDATGKTLRQIENEIRTRLADGWVRDPQVSVDIDQYRTRNVYIIGEVKAPGKVPLIGQVTLIEALAQVGYLTQTAGTEVLVIHATREQQASGKPLSPQQVADANTTRVNFAQLQEGKLGDNVILNEGDTIFVPKAQKFYIMGQVKTAGPFTWEPGMTARQALSLAGGVTEKGSDRRLRVTQKRDEKGVPCEREIDADTPAKEKPDQDFCAKSAKEKKYDIDLQDLVWPNDTIEVPQRLL